MFLTRLDLCRRNQPSLDIEVIVRPLDTLSFAPRRGQRGIIAGELAPVPSRAGPNLGRSGVITPHRRGRLAVPGHREVREVAESAEFFGTFPNGPDRVIGEG